MAVDNAEYARHPQNEPSNIIPSTGIDALFRKSTDFLADRYHLFCAAVYLVDANGQNAFIHAAAGPGSETLLSRTQPIQIQSNSFLGWVIHNKTSQSISATSQDDTQGKKDFLPGVRSELIIPIVLDSHIYGILDLHNSESDTFSSELRDILNAIAVHLAFTIEYFTKLPSGGISSRPIKPFPDQTESSKGTDSRLLELEAINATSQAISTASGDMESLYRILHEQIRAKMGDINLLIALYDPATDSINIPYLYERGEEITRLETFPLGEGLTSIIIRTKQPLMILEDTERRALALGAKIVGQPAKSWLGTPMIVAGNILGAIIVQDPDKESAFDSSDLRFMTTLSNQVASAINNAQLLTETRKRTLQLQTASEIARDISSSLDLNELLAEAVTLIRDRFDYYHAAVFLVDSGSEEAIIREATGDAGTQMKRAGHRLKVGSKSIVGYVTGSGEPLTVNDTTRDATYYPNPLLPDTRSEVAIPLKVGTRIVGALDVQSNQVYAFKVEDINVLRIIADQLAIAVINSELFAETQEHLSQHRLLHHVTTAAASGTTLEEALSSAAQGLQVTLGGDRVAILLMNREKQILEVRAVAGYSEEVRKLEIPLNEGITGWVAIHQQPQRIDDVAKDARYVQAGANIRSELAIPMVYRGEVLGVLNVESDQPSAYSENDEELLGTLGGSLAAIIANARLLEQIRRQADRERLLYEVTSKIRRSTDMQTIMATTTSELSKAMGARRAEIKIDVGAADDAATPSQGRKSG